VCGGELHQELVKPLLMVDVLVGDRMVMVRIGRRWQRVQVGVDLGAGLSR
jgi:hypothetical protein